MLFICLIAYASFVTGKKRFEDEEKAGFVVKTSIGRFRGFQVDLTGHGMGNLSIRKANIFLGVPFARPPLEQLRFERPQSPKHSYWVRNATTFAPACLPIHASDLSSQEEYSEDCLYLNIFSPNWKSGSALFPVLAFIHGGAFEKGNAAKLGYRYLVDNFVSEGILVVTIQYRVGPLGFASLGEHSFGGNYGLWDQLAALQFINENIDKFGGNTSRITLWGQSAGAGSVSALSISSHSARLFSQSIQMSGSILSRWYINNRTVAETQKLAAAMRCEEGRAVKECLRGASTQQLLQAMHRIGPSRSYFRKFVPVGEGDDFFANFPKNLIVEAPSKPTMVGVVPLESLLFTLLLNAFSTHKLYVERGERAAFGRDHFEKFVADVLAFEQNSSAVPINVTGSVIKFYLDGTDERERGEDHYFLHKYTELLSDLMFVVPSLIEADEKAKAGWPVFFYSIAFMDQNAFPNDIPVKGVFHGVEYPFLFGVPYLHSDKLPDFDKKGLEFKRQFVDSIVQFVKMGNPSTHRLQWPVWTTNSLVELGGTDRQSAEEVMQRLTRKLRFWRDEVGNQLGFPIVKETEVQRNGSENDAFSGADDEL